MNLSQPVKLSRKRDLGDLIQDSLAFIAQNWRPLFMAALTYLGPLYLIVGMFSGLFQARLGIDFNNPQALVDLFSDPVAMQEFSQRVIGWEFAGMTGVAIFGYVMTVVVINVFMILYKQLGSTVPTPAQLQENTLRSYLPVFGRLIGLMFIVGLIYIVGAFIAGMGMAFLPVVGGFLFIGLVVLMVYLMVALCFVLLITMNEDIGLMQAISRSFSLIKGHWWQTFGLIIVFYLLLMIATWLVQIPVSTVSYLGEGSSLIENKWYLIISGSIVSFLSGLLQVVYMVPINLQYFSLLKEDDTEGNSHLIDQIGTNT
ncbi:MAG: hypothetical protein AAGI38_09150 [Bacteroidota bacterium]